VVVVIEQDRMRRDQEEVVQVGRLIALFLSQLELIQLLLVQVEQVLLVLVMEVVEIIVLDLVKRQ
jgi:hypothetical protein